MCLGFPVPDFDFDDTPLMSIEQPIPISTPGIVTPDLRDICKTFSFSIADKPPMWCTANSTVYTSFKYDGSGPYALKISKHKSRIIEEFRKRRILPLSPYLVTSIDLFEDSLYAILQMELCEDGDLTGKDLSESQLWRLIHDVSSGLEIVHANGWMHLDISPSNILCSNGSFKLADFGTLVEIGKFQSGCEGAGPYVSPETMLFPGDAISGPIDVGPPTDIFSFGVVLLELASKYFAPRGGDERYQLLRRGEIQLGGDLYVCRHSSELINVINSMLRPDPNHRPTASQLANHPFALAAAAL